MKISIFTMELSGEELGVSQTKPLKEPIMRVTIRPLGVDMSREDRNFLQRRLQFALARWQNEIESVIAYLVDENGPRGGEDKTCRLLVVLSRGDPLAIHEQGSDLRDVSSRAAERLAQVIDRRLKRQQRHRTLRPSWN
jgi:putative sigma-54 modulation protein